MATIVVCSQSALLNRNLSASLKPHGHRILVTDSSIALISVCLTQHVELAIIDSKLDYLSALGAIRCLRCTPKTHALPILSLTHDMRYLSEAVGSGADFALAKPVETHALVRHAERLISHYREALGLPG